MHRTTRGFAERPDSWCADPPPRARARVVEVAPRSTVPFVPVGCYLAFHDWLEVGDALPGLRRIRMSWAGQTDPSRKPHGRSSGRAMVSAAAAGPSASADRELSRAEGGAVRRSKQRRAAAASPSASAGRELARAEGGAVCRSKQRSQAGYVDPSRQERWSESRGGERGPRRAGRVGWVIRAASR